MKRSAKKLVDAFPVLVGIGCILASGIGYRCLARILDPPPGSLPSISLPLRIGAWQGEDAGAERMAPEMPLMGWDQWLARRYRRGDEEIMLFMAYRTGVSGIMPYGAETRWRLAGWGLQDVDTEELALPSGVLLPCKIHRFVKRAMSSTVLAYYVTDGEHYPDAAFLRGPWPPRLRRYVATIQITCSLEAGSPEDEGPRSSVRAFVVDSAAAIRAAMPDTITQGK